MANVHAYAVVDISAKAIVIQCEFLLKQILQVFIYSETVSASHVFFSNLKKKIVQKIWCKSSTFTFFDQPDHTSSSWSVPKWAGYTAYACQTDPSVNQVNPIYAIAYIKICWRIYVDTPKIKLFPFLSND